MSRGLAEAILRHQPAVLEGYDYIENRPTGMVYEKAYGYELIFRCAGFGRIEVFNHSAIYVPTDVVQWLTQIRQLGSSAVLDRIRYYVLRKLKDAISSDREACSNADGVCFKKSVLCVGGSK